MILSAKILQQIGSLAICAFALCMSPQLEAGQTIVDDALGFTLTLPDGFAVNPDLVGAAPDIAHAFVLGDTTDDELDIILFIERMRGTIGPERLKPEQMPPGFQGRLFTTQWQGFVVDAFEVPEQLADAKVLTYNVQIPLKRAAIQVKLFGPANREAELNRLVEEVLTGLQGESNWLPSVLPDSGIRSSENYGLILLALAIVFVLGGLVVLFLISKVAPKGTVLAIAIVIYGASWAAADIRLRELVMLRGATRMLGFAGGILGIVDLVRKRKDAA